MSSIDLLKDLYRDLRHRPLSHLIGQRVRVTSALSLEAELRDLLRPAIVRLRDRPEESIKLGVVKYGILDLTFRAEGIEWRSEDSVDIPFLKKYGFVPDSGDDDSLSLLRELDENVRRGETVVRLFLEEDPPRDLATRESGVVDPFPRGFVVKDACLTNASLIWIHKYFY